jgi:DNA-directed RNA polymerase subunit RPC12/RpoP
MQENKNIQEKEFEFEFDYSDIFGECYNHRFICITCKKLVDNFCLEFGDTKPEFVECENCGTKYVKQQECWVSNTLVKVVLGDPKKESRKELV